MVSLPATHSIRVCLSGFLPSDLVRQDGSLVARRDASSVETALDETIDVSVSCLSAESQ